jgi:hypothetical protein
MENEAQRLAPPPPPEGDLRVPDELPFLTSISWFDRHPRDLALDDMLRRYEAGWRHLGVLGDPSPEEWRFIRALVARFGSWLRVPA